jgi:hypothetical protein
MLQHASLWPWQAGMAVEDIAAIWANCWSRIEWNVRED